MKIREGAYYRTRHGGVDMTETNTWPDKPGVPLNPERDGWHWFKTPDGELVPYNWRPAGECERGRWPSQWVYDMEDDWSPQSCTYLGPCLTPDDATALQARVAELEGALQRLLSMNDDRGLFGGEINLGRIDRAWDKARAALEGKKDE